MARIKTEILLDNGDVFVIEKEVCEGDLSDFTGIESFTTKLKRSILPVVQEKLLTQSQLDYKKKKG